MPASLYSGDGAGGAGLVCVCLCSFYSAGDVRA